MGVVRDSARSAAPERTLEQRMEALGRANAIRSARSELKVDIKHRRRSAREVLLEPGEVVLSMKVWDLVISQPKYGRVKVGKLLGRCAISPSKTIGGLSARQRHELAAILR